MGKSKTGGVFGMLRGKVGAATYSIGKDGNGKKQQIVRALPESVSNPQTIAQVLQRMKLAPAQKFYSALSEILSNSYQGVQYGEQSRLEFLRLAMSAEGPYIERGVDRFIPAAYQVSTGSLPEIVIGDFNSGDTTLTTTVAASGTSATGADFAAALGVSEDTMITIITVTNNNGIFTPHYTPFDERFQLSAAPSGLFTLTAGSTPYFVINPSVAGLDTFRMVAAAVIISSRDSSGNWLRSPQTMVLSTQLREQLYGAAAQDAAIASYQDSQSQNAINSDWYLNLGVNQAFAGRLVTMILSTRDGQTVEAVVGLQQASNIVVRTVFTANGNPDGSENVYAVVDGQVTNIGTPTASAIVGNSRNRVDEVAAWVDGMAEQIGIEEAATVVGFSVLYPSNLQDFEISDSGTHIFYMPIVANMSDGSVATITSQHEDEITSPAAVRGELMKDNSGNTIFANSGEVEVRFEPAPLNSIEGFFIRSSSVARNIAGSHREIIAEWTFVNGNVAAYGVELTVGNKKIDQGHSAATGHDYGVITLDESEISNRIEVPFDWEYID